MTRCDHCGCCGHGESRPQRWAGLFVTMSLVAARVWELVALVAS